MSAPLLYLSVALGGAIGATLRFAFGRWALRAFGPDFPWGTFGVNVIGSFAMGLLAALIVERFPGDWGRYAPFLMSGVLGGFTTFSAFALDAFGMIERGEALKLLAYAGGSVALTLAACIGGVALGRAL
ncbi:MAG: fluoride efflux transporter CrcB [Rubrimonas sp.]|uniref:fluoride efflux transporter CrcB n=1 Tax=Rubrimonas sp. TaxID=2036015 RepID=UPI002FDEF861